MAPAVKAPVRINDLAIKLANVNGTGSSSTNNLIMRAIFRMGIPVSGKNLFPSNIQGLPTWYEIRVNKDGWTGRTKDYDLMVAMNIQTYKQDVAEVKSGGYLLYDSSLPLERELIRDDVTYFGVPLAALCNEHFKNPRERILMKNVIYAGALVALLDIENDVVSQLLTEQFAAKEKLRESNQLALNLGRDYALANFECPLPCRLERMERQGDWMITDGNTAAALGCLYAGATVAAWYPITPSTSLMDAFTKFCAKYRTDKETGKANYMVIQAEDELASVGMVLGAFWNGARAFTSTSGPGISLMNELLGLAYYTEIPAVIVDVQRTGPSTGMPTRTQQADLLECAYASHGDTKHLLLFPANPNEAFDFAVKSFDLAEHFQTPVFLMTDLDIGMNDWVVPALQWDDKYAPDHGRLLTADQLQSVNRFYRYANADDENVTPRTLPGHSEKGAFFVRGSGHTALGTYTEDSAEYQEVVDRLKRKHASAAAHMPAAIITPAAMSAASAGAAAAALHANPASTTKIGLVCIGGTDLAVREAAARLAQQDLPVDVMRIRGFPFGKDVVDFLQSHDTIFIVEQNRDAQLRSLLTLETPVEKTKLRSVLVYGGMPLSATDVVDAVIEQMGR